MAPYPTLFSTTSGGPLSTRRNASGADERCPEIASFATGGTEGFHLHAARGVVGYLSDAGAPRVEVVALSKEQQRASTVAAQLHLANDVGDLANARACTFYAIGRRGALVNFALYSKAAISALRRAPAVLYMRNLCQKDIRRRPYARPLLIRSGVDIHFRGG